MFRIIINNKIIGTSLLESGDPENFSISGALLEAGSALSFSEWLENNDGTEEDGIYHLALSNSTCRVMFGTDISIPFAEGSIICAPEGDEIYVEIAGIPKPEYEHFFPRHAAEGQNIEA